MRVRVKLFGLLRRRFPDYEHDKGMEIQVPDGARIEDLLARLKISKKEDLVVTIDGLAQGPDRTLKDEEWVYVFQSVAGG